MFETIVYVILFILVGLTVRFEYHKWKINKNMTNFVTGTNFPILGFAIRFLGKNSESVLKILNDVFMNQPDHVRGGKCWFGTQLIVGVGDPEDLKVILNSDHCLDKPYMYQQLNSNTGILSAPKEQWKHDRKHLTPTFNGTMVSRFLPLFNDKAKRCRDNVARLNGVDDFHRVILKSLLDIHCASAFGMDCKLQSPLGDTLYDNLMTIMKCEQMRVFRPWLKWDITYRLTKEYKEEAQAFSSFFGFLNKVAAAKSLEFTENMNAMGSADVKNQTANLNFLQRLFMMIRQGVMTERTLNDHIYILTAAAVDTTSSAVFNIILMLAIHQEYQEKVVDELRGIFEDTDTPATMDDVSRMVYTEMVIKEALRFLPTAPVLARKCTSEIQVKSGTIPKDAVIMINLERVHKDFQNWGPNAKIFDPDHFLPENLSKTHPYSFMAFSWGPRNCLGIKYALTILKVLLAYLLREFKFTSDLKLEDIRVEMSIVAKVINENPFRIEKRNFK